MTDMRLQNRIDVHDHCEAGKHIIDWTLGRRKLPADLAEFKAELAGIVTVPERYKYLEFVQSKDETLVIRLPERSLLEESVSKAQELDRRNVSRSALNDVYRFHPSITIFTPAPVPRRLSRSSCSAGSAITRSPAAGDPQAGGMRQ